MFISVLISLVFCAMFFAGEFFFSRRRNINDYIIIWMLVLTGMLIQSVKAEEFEPNFSVCYCFNKDASTYTFPPKNFDKSTMGPDYTLNEHGKSLVRKCGRDDSRLSLQKHLYLRDDWCLKLQSCSYVPGNPSAEEVVKMIVAAMLGARGNPGITVYIVFSELFTYYSFQSISCYYDMEACAKAITWHESCFQAFLDHCVKNGY